jgi:hypothetical protein
MASGSFDSEIRQAMTPKGGDAGPPQAKGKSAQSQPKSVPPAPSSNTPQLIRPAAGQMRMPNPASDPVSHAAAIAHAILQHGRVGFQ